MIKTLVTGCASIVGVVFVVCVTYYVALMIGFCTEGVIAGIARMR